MTDRENCLRAIRRQRPEWVPQEYKSIKLVSPSCVRDRVDNGPDWFGVRWRETVPEPGEHLLQDIYDWKARIHFPDLDSLDWAGSAQRDLADYRREEKLLWIPVRPGPFERMHSFMGFENTLMYTLTEPEMLTELLDAYVGHMLSVIDKVHIYYKPDIISIHDDYGTQISLFMSPETWRELFKPQLKRLVDAIHARGIFAILHCCGKVDKLIGDFVELGIDVWESVQPCCDLKSIYAQYGDKISFMPAMDLQRLGTCTPEEARQIVRDTIDTLGKYGNVMPRDRGARTMPQENADAVRDEIAVYGSIYYQKHPIP